MKFDISTLATTCLLAFGVISTEIVEPPCDYKWFTQSIDHFGTHNGTFKQRYSILDQHFKPGGPILYFVGEETTFLDCVNDTILKSFAEQLGGLAVSLEHRYFGQSLPFGKSSNDPQNLRLMTLDNIMMDGVKFMEWLKSTMPGAQDSKVVVASGSYGAYLTTAMRQRYPSTFFAAVSSAAPINGFIRADNSSSGHFPDYTLQQFLAASYEGTMRIRDAFKTMQNAIRHGDVVSVQEGLNLCTAPPVDETAIATLDNIYDTAISVLLGFDYAFARPGRINVTNSFERAINISTASSKPLDILKDSLGLYFSNDSPPCVNWTDAAGIFQAITPVIQRLTFSYAGCTYNPNTVGTMGHPRVFAQNALLSFAPVIENCKKTFGVQPMTEDEIWRRYKISPTDIANSTRIIFSNAEFDSNAGQAPQMIPIGDDVCRSRVLWTNGMGHREDLFKPEEGDKVEVIKTRKKELEILKSWLALCQAD